MAPDAVVGGADARSRLLRSALRLFAEKGYEAATTREIAESAGINVSAIRYYFGDKAGLYRTVFTEPLGELPCQRNRQLYGQLELPAALALLFRDFLEPLKRGEEVRLVMKLHFREMIEPTGAWQQEIEAEIKPQHEVLVALLRQRLGAGWSEGDIHRLAFAIIGMAVHFYVGQDVVDLICPALLADAAAIDRLAEQIARFALAIIEAEAARPGFGGSG